MTQFIKMNRDERRRIQHQIDANEMYNQKMMKWASEMDPKNHIQYNEARAIVLRLESEKCVYWKGKDITINEAKELAHMKKKEYDRLRSLSPLDRIFE